MCWTSATTMRRASWKTVSSFQVGLSALKELAIRLCSLAHNVCITVSWGCSVHLESPKQNNDLTAIRSENCFWQRSLPQTKQALFVQVDEMGSSWRLFTVSFVIFKRPPVNWRKVDMTELVEPYTVDASNQCVLEFICRNISMNISIQLPSRLIIYLISVSKTTIQSGSRDWSYKVHTISYKDGLVEKLVIRRNRYG